MSAIGDGKVILGALKNAEWSVMLRGADPFRGIRAPIFKACPLCGGVEPVQDARLHFPERRLGHNSDCMMFAAREAAEELFG